MYTWVRTRRCTDAPTYARARRKTLLGVDGSVPNQVGITSFGKGIIADQAAVAAALTQPWSNGQTEGQITRLKLVKRQMYGRAKLDLLRARLIAPV